MNFCRFGSIKWLVGELERIRARAMGNSNIIIKASDSQKLTDIQNAFNIHANDSINEAYTIPSNQVNSLQIFGSAADDVNVVKDIVTVF